MEQVKRYENEEVELKNNLVRIGDLINDDGPLLVIFRDARRGDLYLFDWIDNNHSLNRWLIFKVGKSDLNDFINKKVSYKTIFEKNTSSYFYTDISNDEIGIYKIFKLKEVPLDYKPQIEVIET